VTSPKPGTGQVSTGPVTGYRSVPQTVPVTVDVDTTLSVLHNSRRSRVSTVSHRRKRLVSDVSGYSSTSGSSSYDSSSTSTSPHHYRSGRRSRSPSASRRRFSRKERSRQRSGRRSIRKHHSQRRRTVSRRDPYLRNLVTPFHVCRPLYWPQHTLQPFLISLGIICIQTLVRIHIRL